MKSIKAIMLVLAFIVSATTFTADAQFRFGPKVGLTVNDMHFNKSGARCRQPDRLDRRCDG